MIYFLEVNPAVVKSLMSSPALEPAIQCSGTIAITTGGAAYWMPRLKRGVTDRF
jgi:hypothetical protein